MAADGGTAAKRYAPATERNRDVIADVLRDTLPASGAVLEIASGSGEHLVHFAALFPALQWLPSDPDVDALTSIAAWSAEARLANILPPLAIDAAASDWPVEQVDAILCINMVHISPWAATLGLMRGAGRTLPAGAPLYLYGPYLQQGVDTAPGNVTFDANLRARNSDWGLRDMADVSAAAAQHGLVLENIVAMPANNLSLVFRRA